MSNAEIYWEGTLKIRGSCNEIIRFFEENINAYKFINDSGYDTIAINRTEWIEKENRENCEIINWSKLPSFAWIYIESTIKVFINSDVAKCACIYKYGEHRDMGIVSIPIISESYGFGSDSFTTIAKKYNLEIKFLGNRRASRDIHKFYIYSNGEVLESYYITSGTYESFLWNTF